MAVVCEGYPRDQISRDNFIDIQRAIGRLVDGLPKEGLNPRLIDSYWSKGAAVMVCQDEPTRDWLADKIPSDSMGGLQAQSCEHGCSSHL